MYLHTPVVEAGSWWRTDTASGSDTPTTVYAYDGTGPIGNWFVLTGSTVRNTSRDGTARFWSAAATLYLKELTYQGVPNGTVVTSTGSTPAVPVGGAPVDIATISTTVAALPTTYAALLHTARHAPGGADDLTSYLGLYYPERYGTIGGADDATAINAAITAAANAGGGIVYCSAPVYNVSQILLKSKVRLTGAGSHSTVIKALASTNLPTIALADGTQYSFSITNLAVDGNKGNGNTATTAHGIYLHSDSTGTQSNPVLSDIYITNAPGDGLYTDGRGNGSYINVQVYSCDGIGLHVGTSNDSIFTNIDVGRSGSYGIRVEGSNNRFTACNAWYSGKVTAANGIGLYIVGARNQFFNCGAQDNTNHGFVFFNAARCSAVGCIADSNGSNGNGAASGQTAYGFSISGTSTDCAIIGEAFDRFTPATQQAGVNIAQSLYAQNNYLNVREVGNIAASASADHKYKYTKASRTSGNVTISSTTLVTVDSGIDLVIAAQASDLLEIGINAQAGNNAAVNLDFNAATYVSGSEVNRVGGTGTTGTIGAWTIRGGDFYGNSGLITYTVQSSDVSSGVVTLRLLALTSSLTGRPILANTGVPLTWWVRNLTR